MPGEPIVNALIFGKSGQIGGELGRSLSPLFNVTACCRADCDFANPNALNTTIEAHKPRIILNAAAYTAVDRAETEVKAAGLANVDGVAVIANIAKRQNALLVHYSTDYVFDGLKHASYTEVDDIDPLSMYGKSKALGEQAIVNSGCRYLIFRTSWVYASRGNNFLKTILKLANERDSLHVIDDQIGAPTSAELIADVTAHAIRDVLAGRAPSGLYHLTASGETSWRGYAQYILDQAKLLGIPLKTYHAEPISTAEYPLPAARPANSRLDTTKLQNTFGLTMPDWRYHVARTVLELAGNY